MEIQREVSIGRLLAAFFLFFLSQSLYSQTISFNASGLQGESINNPTSLDFGPDGKLYVAQQDGSILQFTVARNSAPQGSGTYTVTNTEVINLVQINVPNHTDDGLVTSIKKRQVTGVYAGGTAAAPIIYATSSDNLIGGGGAINDKNLDTNSGVISKLTWNGSGWDKIDLVRGLPRCEENHSINGLDIFEKDGSTYMLVQQGGHANKGAPSNNFVGTPEYMLSGALLIVNLTQLESMPVYTDPRSNTQYVYDLPTLNDPNREDITSSDPRFPYPSSHPLFSATIDVGDPFGGDDGLNQAFAEAGGPVQIFSPGWRNAYDVVITQSGKIYTSDNGPNTGWGGLPVIYDINNNKKGDESTTSYNPELGDYIKNEFNESGSQGHGDPLHYIGTTDDANGTYYGGHPIPILAFPSRADLITYKNISGSWQETSRQTFASTLSGASGYFNNSFSITDFPDNPRLGQYLSNAVNSPDINILDIINSSTNGICEYTASNFNGALQGNLLTASFNGNINRYVLNAAGDQVVQKDVIFSGFGSTPLDVIALPDGHPFAGTVWAATYGADNITIFEPTESSNSSCPVPGSADYDPLADSDNDGYSNQDEIDNGSNHCSGGVTPTDNDGDFISDLKDTDDDNDNINDLSDAFAIDANNGTTTNLPVVYPFWNNDPGTGFFGLGFTGLMLDPAGTTDYLTQFDENNISFGGAAGKASIDLVPEGNAAGNNNTQAYSFQFGVNVDTSTPPFTVYSRVESPFFGIDGSNTTPIPFQSAGIYIGNGDQDNYLKVVIGHGITDADGIDGAEVLLETDGNTISERYDVSNLISGNAVDIYISIDPASSTAQPFISTDNGVTILPLGTPIALPASWLEATDNQGMAVGIIASSFGSSAPFSAIWDFINVLEDQNGVLDPVSDTSTFDFGTLPVNGDEAQLNVELQNLSGPAEGAIEITRITVTGPDSGLFATNIATPIILGPGVELTLPLSFAPGSTVGTKTALLTVEHSGIDSPLTIPLTASIEAPASHVPIIRINAGGAAIAANDSGPDWLANDTVGAYTSAAFSVNTGNKAGFAFDYVNKHSSIPDYIDATTYAALFGSERWDTAPAPEMAYAIPLANGNYTINLYVGNGYSGTAAPGTRVYDILIENQIVSDDLDLASSFGDKVGAMLSFDATVSDGELTISFAHETENPLINAIEIIQPQAATPLAITAIANQQHTVGNSIDIAVQGSGGNPAENYTYSISGQPDGIAIEPTNGQIFGVIAATAVDGGIAHNGVHTVTVTLSQPGLTPVSTEFEWSIQAPALSWIDKDESENYTARHECSFVQAGDTFIMFGGREQPTTLDVYDYASNTWSNGGTAPLPFNHFQAVSYQGLVWVIGAFQTNSFPNEAPATHIYMYNPATQAWIQGIEIPESRRRGGAGLVVFNDKFYVVGGNTIGHNGGYVPWFDEYDPTTGQWQILTDAPNARDHFQAVTVDGKLYAAGGRLSGGPGGVFAPLIAEVDIYDFQTGLWSTLPASQNIPTPRAASSNVNFNNKLVTIGGEGNGQAYNTVEAFDPVTGQWETLPSLNFARHGTQAIVSGDGIHIAAGSPTQGGGSQKNMEVFGTDNPQGDTPVASILGVESNVNFTYSNSDSSIELVIDIENTTGNIATYIQDLSISGLGFSLSNSLNNSLLNIADTQSVTVNFSATANSTASGTLNITFNNNETLAVTLAGTSSQQSPQIVYRVNAGGSLVNDSEFDWSADQATAPSSYLQNATQNPATLEPGRLGERRLTTELLEKMSY